MYIQAHRGNSGSCPENTLAAFSSAKKHADGIECDIHMTSDGYFAVCHDADIKRTSNGSGLIAEMILGELRKYDFGSWYSKEFKNEKIPTLEEMLDIVKELRIINIEIKQFAHDMVYQPYEKLVTLIYNKKLNENVLISSFDVQALKNIIIIDNKLKTAFLCSSKTPDIIETAINLKCYAIHPNFSLINDKNMILFKENNFEVNVWTVNSEIEIIKCKDYKCDGVITNEPELVKKILKIH